MNPQLIQSVVEEVRPLAKGKFIGKIFQNAPLSFALDIGIRGAFLFISAEPARPRFYLIHRKLKEVEKQSGPLLPFGQMLRTQLAGGEIVSLEKDGQDRVVRLTVRVVDELGVVYFRRLICQLTGKATNLLILDELNRIVAALRPPRGTGQNLNELYIPPPNNESRVLEETISIKGSASEAADKYFQAKDADQLFISRVASIRNQLRQTKTQKLRLKNNLTEDLAGHGDPQKHRRLGDLLLANVSTAVRSGNLVRIKDFYADNEPWIDVDLDEDISLQEAAAATFRQYVKAKRAHEEINTRLTSLKREIEELQQREQLLERITLERDESALANFAVSQTKKTPPKQRTKSDPALSGVRRYLSTDGYEILVGRAAKDNDNLTFRIARPHDLWLHAGDYPGSHVVVRNPTRKEIPQRTVIEAAQLAGRFSQASDDSKVVIHYTERKFLSKPKGSAPGLVRLSSFRSITVEPKESIKRL